MLRLLLWVGLLGLSVHSLAQDVKTTIPPGAKQYLPLVLTETDRLMPNAANKAYIPALIEHESCITLKHKKCWNPSSELKNNREQGVGLGQLTRTWRPDGTVRFDSLAMMKRAYDQELRELSWATIKNRPDIQIRTMLLMVRESYGRYPSIKNKDDRYHFADSDYNGGGRDVNRARIACGLATGCNSQRWFDHVERYSPKPRNPDVRYGGRSLRDISLNHTRDVIKIRLPKYQTLIKESVNERPSLTGPCPPVPTQ